MQNEREPNMRRLNRECGATSYTRCTDISTTKTSE